MYETLWKEVYKSICGINLLKNGNRIASGTGFKVKDKLITNYHLIPDDNITHVNLRFVNDDGYTEYISETFQKDDFIDMITDSMPVNSWDYAVIDLDWDGFSGINSLNLSKKDELEIGQSIVFLGFQFGQQNLSIHSGIISSRFVAGDVKYLQLGASVNQGNSGGPLLNPHTRDVIGIITRKATGLTEQFDALLDSFTHNIAMLEDASKAGRMQLFGIDPIESMKITQTQMAKISLEIKRSANVGIGFAYEIEKLRKAIEM